MKTEFEIAKARSVFADELSLSVFDSRLKYAQTGDNQYLFDMIETSMKMCRNQRFDFTNNYKLLKLSRLVLTSECNSTIILFGCGGYSKTPLQLLYEYGILQNPKCSVVFADNNSDLWDTKSEHHNPEQRLSIISKKSLREYVNKKNVYILLTISSTASRFSVEEQLLSYGFNPESIIDINISLEYGIGEIYFDDEIMIPHGNDEVFVDIGAYDMTNTKDFYYWCDGKYKKIVAFEADAASYEKCDKIIKQTDIVDIELYNYAVYFENSTLKFNSAPNGEYGASRIDDKGTNTVKAVSLDCFIEKNLPVSIIKMDIEGAESDALNGAKELIQKYKPRLALSAYHKPFDIIDLSLQIKDINPEYTEFYLRHHTCGVWDTVLYAL